jgi:ribosomal protein S21
MLITKFNDTERKYFEAPTFELKRQLANLRKQLKTLNH